MHVDRHTDRWTDRHDEYNSQFCSSANASKSDWTVFHTAAKINSQEGRSVILINIKKRSNANGNILLPVCWLEEGGGGSSNISNRKVEQRGK
jgi:hypothetical protein